MGSTYIILSRRRRSGRYYGSGGSIGDGCGYIIAILFLVLIVALSFVFTFLDSKKGDNTNMTETPIVQTMTP